MGRKFPGFPPSTTTLWCAIPGRKSLSLPGDRIGYVLVPNEVEESERVMFAVAGAGRALGYICAPVFFQRVIAACVDEPVNASAYAANRELLTQGLDELGYHYIAPDGALLSVDAGFRARCSGVFRQGEGTRAVAGSFRQLWRWRLGARKLLRPC